MKLVQDPPRNTPQFFCNQGNRNNGLLAVCVRDREKEIMFLIIFYHKYRICDIIAKVSSS